ncbi:MAG: alpha/beta fold hydrolase [Candidatus Dormibacteria bacterium]
MSSEARRQMVQAPDGRQLEVVSAGPEDGRCFLFHSGTPSAAGAYPPLVEALAQRDLRLVTFSRPGYAGSSAMAGRAVSDVAADVQAILDSLKIGAFFCAGQSGGGPHALACAALLPDRVLATATLAGVAPWPADGLDWFAGMGQENLDEFGASIQGREPLEAYLDREAARLQDVKPADVAAALGSLVSDVDKAALTAGYAEFMAASLRGAISTGISGWRDDDIAFVNPWGFDLSSIQTPVVVWQGGADRMVPMAHGAWLAANIPGAEQHLLPEEGHLSLALNKMGDVLDGLLAMGKSAARPAHAS